MDMGKAPGSILQMPWTAAVLVFCLSAASLALAEPAKRSFGLPAEGAPETGIISSAEPSAEQLGALAEAGFTTVVDLRTEAEMSFDEREIVESLGMTYHSIPVGSASAVTKEAALQLDGYLAAATGPVLVHCATSNRVGALFAVREHLAGADAEAAIDKGKKAGLTSLEDRVREVIDQAD
jgi:uncharacterized protein (TIGR01244 family)